MGKTRLCGPSENCIWFIEFIQIIQLKIPDFNVEIGDFL